jgi:predicted nucleic acid-binding protein
VALRVALDANVLIAGTAFPRWPHEVLRHALRGDYLPVLSPIVIREARRRIVERFPDYAEQFETFLALADYEDAPVPTQELVARHQDLVRQREDVPVALSVIAAEVDYFVTYDRDFTDEDESTAKVRKAIPGILLPPVFLRDVMGWTSEELEAIRTREWSDLSDG